MAECRIDKDMHLEGVQTSGLIDIQMGVEEDREEDREEDQRGGLRDMRTRVEQVQMSSGMKMGAAQMMDTHACFGWRSRSRRCI